MIRGHASLATAPPLVLQGDKDIRVPKEEAEQVVSIDAIRRMIDWFDRYLR